MKKEYRRGNTHKKVWRRILALLLAILLLQFHVLSAVGGFGFTSLVYASELTEDKNNSDINEEESDPDLNDEQEDIHKNTEFEIQEDTDVPDVPDIEETLNPRIEIDNDSFNIFQNESMTTEFEVVDLDLNGIVVTAVSDDQMIIQDSDIQITDMGGGRYELTMTPVTDAAGNCSVQITAQSSDTASNTVTVTINTALQPVVGTIPVLKVKEGDMVSFNIEDVCTDPQNLPLSYSIETSPQYGNIILNDGLLEYTPDINTSNSDSIVVRVSNGYHFTDVNISIEIYGDLTVPTGDQNFTINEDSSYTADLGLICSDSRNNSLDYSVGSGPVNGQLAIVGGVLTYTPDANYFGTDSFSIHVTNGDSSKEIVFLGTIISQEDAPIAVDDDVTVESNSSVIIDVLANDIVVDTGSELELLEELELIPSKALSCKVENGKIKYVPNRRASGTDVLKYKVRHKDGTLVAIGTVTITITPKNNPPEIEVLGEPFIINEDNQFIFSFTVTDIDSADIENNTDIEFTSSNTNIFKTGTLTTSIVKDSEDKIICNVTWTPEQYANTDELGPVEITIKVTDKNDSQSFDTVTFPVIVNPVNNAPVILNLPSSFTMLEDEEEFFEFDVYDPDISDPLSGFDVKAVSSDTGIINAAGITITGPVYVDSRTARYTIKLKPLKDQNTGTGSIPIQITVADDGSGSDKKEVSDSFDLFITPVPDPPTARNNSYVINEDVKSKFTVLDNDTDPDGNDTIKIISTTGNMAGSTVDIDTDENGKTFLWYTPAQDYYGTDSFYYTIEDETGNKATARVSITIRSVNDLPEFHGINSTYSTPEDTPLTITFNVSDVETSAESLMLQAIVLSGANLVDMVYVEPVDSSNPGQRVIQFIPEDNMNGMVVLNLMLNDGQSTAQFPVIINIDAVNDDPVAVDDTVQFIEDTPVYILVSTLMKNDKDVDIATNGDFIKLHDFTPPAHGSLTLTTDPVSGEPAFLYIPDLNWDQNDSFEYIIIDSHGATATATVKLVCTPVNDVPTLDPIPDQETDEDTPLSIMLNYNDIETENVDLIITASSSNTSLMNAKSMTIDKATGKLTMNPLADCYGETIITITVSDGQGSVTQSFKLTVNPVPDAPVANDAAYTTKDGSPLIISPMDNDYDVDGDEIRITSIVMDNPPSGMELVSNGDGTYTFVAPVGFSGVQIINYTITDTTGLTANAVIRITVEPNKMGATVEPVSTIITYADSTIPDIPLNIKNVPAGDDYKLSIVSSNQDLVKDTGLSINGGSNVETGLVGDSQPLRITLEPTAIGETYITVTLEHNGEIDSTEFLIMVTRDNNAPTANDDAVTIKEGETVEIDVLANDDDVQRPLDISILYISQKPTHGDITILSDGKIRYVPNTSYGVYYFNGVETIKYVITDGGGLTAEATVTITIEPMPSRPIAHADYIILENDVLNTLTPVDGLLTNDRDYDGPAEEATMEIAEIISVGTPTVSCSINGLDPTKFDFMPDAPGWYEFTYKNKTYGPDESGKDVWLESTFTTAWIGVKDANGVVPPKIASNSYYVREDLSEDVGTYSIDITHLIKASNTTLYPLEYEPSGFVVEYPGGEPILADVNITETNGKFELNITTAKDKNGRVDIKWKVSQNGAESNEGKLVVIVDPVNDAPVVQDIDDIVTYRGDLTEVELDITDVDNTWDQLKVTAVTSDNRFIPSDSISITKKSGDDKTFILSFNPPRNPDDYSTYPIVITVTASDGDLTDSKSFNVTIKPKNRPPVEGPIINAEIDEDTIGEFNVVDWGTDPDGDIMSIICDESADPDTGIFLNGVRDDNKGTLLISGKKIIFIPNKDYNTPDNQYIEIRYKLQDPEGSTSEIGYIRIKIKPVNDPPLIYQILDRYTMAEDSIYNVAFKVKDVDQDDLTFRAEHDDPTKIKDLNITYIKTAPGEYDVTLEITPQPDAHHPEGTAEVDLSQITVIATDTHDVEGEHTFRLSIYPVNDAPRWKPGESNPILREIDEDTTLEIDLTEYFEDVDGDVISITSLTKPLHGSVSTTGSKAIFTPTKDYFTRDPTNEDDYAWFDFTISDPYNGQISGRVKILVNPVNDPPTVPNLTKNTDEDVPIEIDPMTGAAGQVVDDVDDDISTLRITGVTNAANGTVEIVDGGTKIKYTPDQDWYGTDTFKYTVSDPHGGSATGTITIKVASVLDDPRLAFYQKDNPDWDQVESNESDKVVWTMKEDTPTSFDFRMWQPEVGKNLILVISAINLDDEGEHSQVVPREQIELIGSGEYRQVKLSPLLNQYGRFRLKFELSDGKQQIVRYVEVDVESVNDLPVFSAPYVSTGEGTAKLSMETDEDTKISNSIAATDVETAADKLVFGLHDISGTPEQPDHGTVVVEKDGAQWKWTYTPDADYFGTDEFKIDVIDEDGGVSTATITVTVKPINDAPTKPLDITLDKAWYKNGNQVSVLFTAGTDKYNETPRDQLTYDIEYSINGGLSWTHLETDYLPVLNASFEGVYTFFSPANVNTDGFKVRMRTHDTVIAGTAAKYSDWEQTINYKIDNKAPEGNQLVLTPTGYTTQDVEIEFVVNDPTPGDTGVSVITKPAGVSVVEEDLVTGECHYKVEKNGTYTFVLEDVAGNTENFVVTVTNIDRLDPEVAATPSTGTGSAVSPVTVVLTYSDQAQTADYAESGVKDKEYIVTKDTVIPESGDSRWADYTAGSTGIDLTTKGVWYIYGKVVDYAGNEVIEQFGAYTILNSIPEATDGSVTVYEHTVDSTKKNTVEIRLSDFVTDADNDPLTYEITQEPSPSGFGTFTKVSEGVYTFTHNGNGAPPFQLELELKYKAKDDDLAESAEKKVTINVVEVNDKPDAPDITGPSAGGIYRDDGAGVTNGIIPLTWTEGSDEETAQALLVYEIEVTYDGTTWSSVTTTSAGATNHSFQNTGGENTDKLQFRVRAVDDDITNPESSDWAYSPKYILDNTAPEGEQLVLTPSGYTTLDVEFKFVVKDPTPGATGVVSVTKPAGTELIEENLTTGVCRYKVEKNGTYTFTFEDAAGNKGNYDVIIATIDRLDPKVEATPTTGTGSAVSPVNVVLTYSDQVQTADYAESGVKDKKYIVAKDSVIPDSGDSRWADYTAGSAGIDLTKKGVWYVYGKVVDYAGNEVIEQFGAYTILNSVPQASDGIVTVYEHTVDDTKKNTVEIRLSDFVTDADNDPLTFEITQEPMPSGFGTFTKVSEGVYTFTHNGNGAPPFQTELELKYKAKDDDLAESVEKKITIKVEEVNDKPEAPDVTGPSAGEIYRDDGVGVTNGIVPLTWTEGSDEETIQSLLVYEVEVTYDGGTTWITSATTAAGAAGYNFQNSGGENTDELQFRVRAVDNDVSDQKNSDWAYSPKYILDNKAPDVVSSITPLGSTNGDVEIRLTVSDPGPASTGVVSVTKATDAEALEENLTTGVCRYKVDKNGTYTFVFKDAAGNEKICDIIISNIDKLNPKVEAAPATGTGSAVSPVTVVLTYSDQAQTTDYAESGVKDKKYIVAKDATVPDSGDSRWTDYTAGSTGIELTAKGVWYVYGKVVDHAGNEVIEQFGAYTIQNSVPQASDGSVTVYEHTVDDTKKNTVEIRLSDLVTDADNDPLTYEITQEPMPSGFGTLTKVSEGVYTFTHNGNGAPPFESALVLKYKAKDDDLVESVEKKVTINVEEVNDKPEAPDITGPSAGEIYRDDGVGVTNGIVPLAWDSGNDEETAQALLIYEIEVTYDGTTWTSAGTTTAGATGYNFRNIGGENTDKLQFRVRTVDDDATDQLRSDWVYSPKYVLDNKLPDVLSSISPLNITNGDVEIRLTVSDPGPISTGVASITKPAGAEKLEENLTTGVCRYKVKKNGTYNFVIKDTAGNEKPCQIIVTNIDKLNPKVEATPSTGTGSVVSPLTVVLSYSDQAQTADYAESGVKDKKYIVTTDAVTPGSGDSRWSDYTAGSTGIELTHKGVWYIYGKVVDHAGNEVIEKFGAYTMQNSVPQATDRSVTVYEHTIDDTKKNTVEIRLSDYTTDADSDPLTYEITQEVTPSGFGTLTKISEGVYTFTHNGKGAPPFEPVLVLKYKAKDDDLAESAEKTITINVIEVNDAPTAPAITGPAEGSIYRDNVAIPLTWNSGSDEETATSLLVYEMEVTYDGTTWSSIGTTAGGATGHNYKCSGGNNTNNLQFRVRTVDDDAANQLKSDWTYSKKYILDNKAPEVQYSITPVTDTNGDVEIRFTVSDPGPVSTGVVSVTKPSGTEIVEENLTTGICRYKVKKNGTYTFVFKDAAGNEKSSAVVITNIDKLNPTVVATPATATGSVTSPITVVLTYSDQAQTTDYAQSGVKEKKYIVSKGAGIPTSADTRWADYTAGSTGIDLTTKGVWYVFGKVVDHAGNEVIEKFGAYTMQNSVPQAADRSVTVYEHTVDSTKTNTVEIRLIDYVTDADNDPLTYEITQEPSPSGFGTLTKVSEGVYTFTHNGKGAPPFEPVLELKYKAIDDDLAESVEKKITINVKEVNDKPEAPVITGPSAGDIFRDDGAGVTNGIIPLTWDIGNDEETAQALLVYEMEITYDGTTWLPIGTTAAGAAGHNFQNNSGENSNNLQFRLRTVDDDILDQKQSDWAYSPKYVLDNKAPEVDLQMMSKGNIYAPGSDTNYPIIISFTFTDGTGSGLSYQKYCITNSAVKPADHEFNVMTSNTAAEVLTAIDTYYLHLLAEDVAGNQMYVCTLPLKIVNTLPKVYSQELTVDEGSTISKIVLKANDDDPGDGITEYEIVNQPLYGTLTPLSEMGQYSYTHDGTEPVGSKSQDRFTYRVKDSNNAWSVEAATVTIKINPVNDPPQIQGLSPSYTMDEDTVLKIPVTIEDPDDPLSSLKFSVVSDSQDIISKTGINFKWNSSGGPGAAYLIFKPEKDMNTNGRNPVKITITVRDPHGAYERKQIEIEVLPVNDPPDAYDQYYMVLQNGGVDGKIEATDRENDTLSYSLVQSPNAAYGTLDLDPDFANNGKFRYNADASFPRDGDYFKVKISDGTNDVIITVYISMNIIAAEDEDPVGYNIEMPSEWKGNNTASISVVSDNLGLVKPESCEVKLSQNGNLSFTFIPERDKFGTATVSVIVKTSSGELKYEFPVIVKAENDAPVRPELINLEVYQSEGGVGSATITPDDSIDEEFATDGFLFSCDNLIEQPQNGDITIGADGKIVYQADPGFEGIDEFTITILESTNNLLLNPAPVKLPAGVELDTDDRMAVKTKFIVEVKAEKTTGGFDEEDDKTNILDDFAKEISDEEIPDINKSDDGKTKELFVREDTFEHDKNKLVEMSQEIPAADDKKPKPKPGAQENPIYLESTDYEAEGELSAYDMDAAYTVAKRTNIYEESVNEIIEYNNLSKEEKQNIEKDILEDPPDMTLIGSVLSGKGVPAIAFVVFAIVILFIIFLLLLWFSRIRIIYEWNKDGKTYTVDRILYFRRLHHRKGMLLNITNTKIEDLNETEITVLAGLFYRRKFYENEIDFIFDDLNITVELPEKDEYKENGIMFQGSDMNPV